MFSLHSGYVLSMFLEGLLLCFVYGCIYVQSTFCLRSSLNGSFYVSYMVVSMLLFSLHSGYALSMFLEGLLLCFIMVAPMLSLQPSYVLSIFLEWLLLCFVYGCVYVQSIFRLCSVYVP